MGSAGGANGLIEITQFSVEPLEFDAMAFDGCPLLGNQRREVGVDVAPFETQPGKPSGIQRPESEPSERDHEPQPGEVIRAIGPIPIRLPGCRWEDAGLLVEADSRGRHARLLRQLRHVHALRLHLQVSLRSSQRLGVDPAGDRTRARGHTPPIRGAADRHGQAEPPEMRIWRERGVAVNMELVDQVLHTAAAVLASGAISGNGHGNVSLRVPGAEEMYFTSASSLNGLGPDGIARVALDGTLLEGTLPPSRARSWRCTRRCTRIGPTSAA